MATSEVRSRKRRISGKFCVAGGPGNVSCTNNSLVPGISMHTFPLDEVVRRKWTKFVQKHQSTFKPSRTSVLCSVHFSQECFTRRLDLLGTESQAGSFDVSSSRRLNKGTIPTIDTAITPSATSELSRRDKRKIIKQALIEIQPQEPEDVQPCLVAMD
ncbi:hypothetical protein QZH41_016879 [Actinostola sp. cb2023]|nr:hypothetical protein QZH41_016879 [Actinostola sp. cb2023]